MSYRVPCACGGAVEVKAADAGADLPCRCGRTVRVPLLSQLRRSAGESPASGSVIDTITFLVNDGKLPPDSCCAVSGLPCDETHRFYVECERMWVKGGWTTGSILFNVIAWFVVPFWTLKLLLTRNEPPELLGRERGVYVPLRVRSEFKPKLRKMSQAQLRAMLRSVEIYQKLLDQYPNATIHV